MKDKKIKKIPYGVANYERVFRKVPGQENLKREYGMREYGGQVIYTGVNL